MMKLNLNKQKVSIIGAGEVRGAKMVRSERLFILERLLREKKVTSLEDLCKQFGVSPRTMYRDIRALSNVDVPVYFENGYRLESTNPEGSNPLTDDEQLLLMFSLHNNPLCKYRVLRQRLERLIKKLIGLRLISPQEKSRSFSFQGRQFVNVDKDDKNLRVFLRSINRKVNVRIRLKNHDLEERVYQPRSIVLSESCPSFIAVGQNSKREKTLSFDEVETVTELM